MDREPDFGEVERSARRLARAPEAARKEVEAAVADYALDLRLAHLTDSEITPGPHLLTRARKALVTTILLVVLSPVIVFGLLANLLPYLLVRIASRRVRVPVTKGTVRMLVSIAVFPLTWILLAAIMADSLWVQIVLVVAFAAAGFASLWALEETVLNARMLFAWRAARGERRWFADLLRDHRGALAAKVQEALEAQPP